MTAFDRIILAMLALLVSALFFIAVETNKEIADRLQSIEFLVSEHVQTNDN